MALLLRGAPVAAAINEKTGARADALTARGCTPTLAVLRAGERKDDMAYERSAVKSCAAVGIRTKCVTFPEDVTQKELIDAIYSLNADEQVHGVLILRPLPAHIDDRAARAALAPAKDVDGVTDASLAGVFTGGGHGFAPCTAQACMEILDHYGIDCAGKRAVVIGRSLVVGKPTAMLMLAKNATVTICHTKTKDLAAVSRSAEILIVAAGKAESVTQEFLSAGQTVIDVGINWSEEKQKLCGDVRFDQAEPVAGAVTPVPGGVGTVTTAVLAANVVCAAEQSRAREPV